MLLLQSEKLPYGTNKKKTKSNMHVEQKTNGAWLPDVLEDQGQKAQGCGEGAELCGEERRRERRGLGSTSSREILAQGRGMEEEQAWDTRE